MGNQISDNTIQTFNVKRYLGKWYEIAKKPTVYGECTMSTAEYTWVAEKRGINVLNTCYECDKILSTWEAFAYVPCETDPGKLKLKYTDYQGCTKISDYWIHCTDYDSYAIVGGPTGDYLWILSRDKKITQCRLNHLINHAKLYGYNVDDLQLTDTMKVCPKCK